MKRSRGSLRFGAALSLLALLLSPARGRTVSAVEAEIEAGTAIAQDPGLGRAYHVRAMWNRKIAGLSFLERTAARAVLGGVPKGASMDNAVSDFQKAIELEPGYVNHHLELGRTFLELDRKDDPRRDLEKPVPLPPTTTPR